MSTPDPRDAVFQTEGLKAELSRKTGQSSVTVILYAGFKLAVQLITTAILARLILPGEHGIVAMAMPALIIARGLSEMGLPQAIVQRAEITHRLVSTLFWINAVLGLAFGALMVLLAEPAARFYGTPEVANVFRALGVCLVCFSLVGQYTGILRRQLRIRSIERSSLVANIASVLVAIIMAFMGYGYWALVVQMVLNPALNLLLLIWQAKWLPSLPWASDRLSEAKSSLSFGGYLLGSRLITDLVNNAPLIVAGRVFSESAIGLYYRAALFSRLPQSKITGPLGGLYMASLSRLQDQPEAFREMYERIMTRLGLIIVPVALLMITCPDLIVAILLGPNWLESGPILGWLALNILTATAMNGFLWSLTAMGETRALFFYRLISLLIVPPVLILGAQYDIVTLVSFFVLTFVLVLFPMLAALALWKTPLTLGTLKRAYLAQGLQALLLFALVTGLRGLLPPLHMLVEFILCGAVIGILSGGAALLNPAQRKDILTALKSLKSSA